MTILDGNFGHAINPEDAGMSNDAGPSERKAPLSPTLRLVTPSGRNLGTGEECRVDQIPPAADVSVAATLAPLCLEQPRRMTFGPHAIECLSFAKGKRLTLKATNASILVVIPASGGVALLTDGYSDLLVPGTGALLARPANVRIEWGVGASGLVLHLSRARLQARASKISGSPMRLSAAAKTFVIDAVDARVEPVLVHVLRSILDAESAGRVLLHDVDVLLAAIVTAIGSDLFVRSRSVSAAQDYLAAHRHEPVTLERLATIAGVAERTLREAFREVLGQSLPAYIAEVRLHWARERLASAMEGRPIEAVAKLAGYKSGAAFTRAYRDLFGETPTVTRAIAVRGDSATR